MIYTVTFDLFMDDDQPATDEEIASLIEELCACGGSCQADNVKVLAVNDI